MSDARLRTVRHGAEYLMTRGLEAGVRILPAPVAHRAGAGAAALAHGRLRIRREVVEGNLRIAFPERSDRWRAETARASYVHLAREALSTVRLSHLGPEGIRERADFTGWEEIRAAHALGRGVILLTGHFGNWEMGAAAVAARGVPVHGIVRRQSNMRVDRRFAAMRRRFGVGTIDAGDATRGVTRGLRAGHVLGFVGDQDAREAGIWVPFFGRWTSTFRGAAVFALRKDVPVFFCACRRLPGSRPTYRVETKPLGVLRTGNLETDTRRLIEAFSGSLEEVIRRHPDQYFWVHRRWKTPPPPELAAVTTGTTGDVTPPGTDSPATGYSS